MSWSNLATLQANGSDIVSHSLSHLSLETLDNSTLYAEIGGAKTLLASRGINTDVFVYPYGEGAQNVTVQAVISQYYKIARGINEAPVDLSGYDKYNLPAYEITNETTLVDFEAYTYGQLSIVYYHQIDPSDTSVVSPSQLTEQMQFLKDNGYVVATMKDLSEIL